MSELSSEVDAGTVNPHYLDHLVHTAEQQELQASEDIIAGNGMKLLAKGARVSAALRDRLLEHKLTKPLEECVVAVGGIGAAELGPVALELLERHELLRVLCASPGDGRAQPIEQSLPRLALTPAVLSMFNIYAQHQPGRLHHAVGVAMLAMALGRRLLLGDIDRHRMLATAGLVHDIGELYIEPSLFKRETTLDASQWKHIATHPVVGHRVLLRMPGGGKQIAEAVLNHHERLDGFGYPRSIRDEQFPLEGQLLAAAEWLMGLVESDANPLAHASVASKLIPGEFSPALLEIISATARASHELEEHAEQAPALLDAALPELQRVLDAMQRYHDARDWLTERIAAAPPELRVVLLLGQQRLQRIRASFSSSGLDVHAPEQMLAQLRELPDPHIQLELAVLVREFGWRLRELQRESLLRAGLLGPADLAVMHELIDRLNGTATVGAAAQAAA